MISWVTFSILVLTGRSAYGQLYSSEDDAQTFVDDAEKLLQAQQIKSTFSAWNYDSNIRDDTLKVKLDDEEEYNKLYKKIGKSAQKYNEHASKFQDKDVRRKLKLLSNLGTSVLRPDKQRKFSQLKAEMQEVYGTAKVLDFENGVEKFSLEPELTNILAQSRDPEVLQYYWEAWRDQSGKKIKDKYKEYVDFYNEAAILNGHKDASEMKVVDYESDTFMQEMEETWQGLKPLYQQLHAYVRSKLNKVYGDKVVKKDGTIPAHLLGNMWAQQWNNLADILIPYPSKPSINVTGEMVKQNWTPKKMFKKAEDFFTSMGLDPMPQEFWTGSILEKPTDPGRELVCHASAWDFYNGKDFRIKQCTRVDQDDFVTVNHEMGHIQYFLQYKNLSHLYRTGANPGFHEGVADILSLAVGTATYFQKLGLLSSDIDIEDEETNINILMDMALQRIAFLPFGYLVDKFRWDVYSNKTSTENMNCHWWKLRHELQGLSPPKARSYRDFDAGAKYHVAADVGYVRYFTAFIYEFQFYRSICLATGDYVPGNPSKPLHRCNFYGSIEAGNRLREMLKLGASKPWKEAMRTLTGQPEMKTDALRDYFKPLEVWLIRENKKNKAKIGWGPLQMSEVCTEASSAQGLISWTSLVVVLLAATLKH